MFDPRLENHIYYVGGYVRDKMLGLEPDDIDVAIENITEEEMLQMDYKKVHKRLPVFKRKDDIDYALCRREIKTGEGYTGFDVETKNVDIIEDLKRRDFTINSIAIKYSTNSIIDPFNGVSDLENKILRATSDAFKEDPVRALRLARFSARFSDFSIEPNTILLAKSLKEELKLEPKERIWKELEKTLSLTEEDSKPSNFFRTLKDLEMLDITFPEIYKMTLVMHTNPIHHAEESVFEHVMRVLDEICFISKDPIVRFGSLMHDVGKANVSKDLKPGQFHGHDKKELVEELLEKMKEENKIPNSYIFKAKQAAILHHKFHGVKNMNEKGLKRLIDSKYFPKSKKEFLDLISIVNSDNFGRVIASDENAPMLSKEECDLVFKEMFFEKNGFFYEISDEQVDARFLAKVFDIANEKPDVLSFMNQWREDKDSEPTPYQITDFIHNFYLRKFRKILDF
jgi:tRNA nucleotidyltransferase (CCA-adding enzyme)